MECYINGNSRSTCMYVIRINLFPGSEWQVYIFSTILFYKYRRSGCCASRIRNGFGLILDNDSAVFRCPGSKEDRKAFEYYIELCGKARHLQLQRDAYCLQWLRQYPLLHLQLPCIPVA